MRTGLFVPCYIDQMYPEVGLATLSLLRGLGVEVEVPLEQTCCGQPLVNMGCTAQARPVAKRFGSVFGQYNRVVCPSASCTHMVRRYQSEGELPVAFAIRELSEFLLEDLGVTEIEASFPHRVALHRGCHGLRGLGLGPMSETMTSPRRDVAKALLRMVDGLELVEPQRSDECCGFGGSFMVSESAVSTMMGNDKIDALERVGAEVVVSSDMSCLMHLESLLTARGSSLVVMHLAEVLSGQTPRSRRSRQ
jgi:L-lactate dehydrogenase complex protein LldE